MSCYKESKPWINSWRGAQRLSAPSRSFPASSDRMAAPPSPVYALLQAIAISRSTSRMMFGSKRSTATSSGRRPLATLRHGFSPSEMKVRWRCSSMSCREKCCKRWSCLRIKNGRPGEEPGRCWPACMGSRPTNILGHAGETDHHKARPSAMPSNYIRGTLEREIAKAVDAGYLDDEELAVARTALRIDAGVWR